MLYRIWYNGMDIINHYPISYDIILEYDVECRHLIFFSPFFFPVTMYEGLQVGLWWCQAIFFSCLGASSTWRAGQRQCIFCFPFGAQRPTSRALAMPSHSAGLPCSQLDLARWTTTKNFQKSRIWGEIQPVQAAPSQQELLNFDVGINRIQNHESFFWSDSLLFQSCQTFHRHNLSVLLPAEVVQNTQFNLPYWVICVVMQAVFFGGECLFSIWAANSQEFSYRIS